VYVHYSFLESSMIASIATPAANARIPAAAVFDNSNDCPVLLPPRLGDDPDAKPVEVFSAGERPRQRVEWLWRDRIPFGKVTLLAGDPGLGKSLVALDIAARVTVGAPFPATRQQSPRNPTDEGAVGSVLVLTNEDDVADTIRPRLEAHGGNVHRVFFAPKITDLRSDFGQLVAALDRISDCRLIIVDPVRAFVGASDSHFHTVVRRVLRPLADLAAARGIAVLAITHFRKNEGTAIHRAAGTTGFVGFARTVWTITRDQRNPERRMMLPVKNNLGATDDGLAYTIRANLEFDAPVVEWESQPLGADAIEEAAAAVHKPRGPEAEERRAASDWLTTALTPGPRNAGDLIREGKELGYHPRTLRRGLEAIGGRTSYHGMFDGWMWSLPKPEPPLTNTPQNAPTSASTSTSSQTPSTTKPPQTQPVPTPPPKPGPQAGSVPTPGATAKKLVPLNETCPLTGNNAIQGARGSGTATSIRATPAELDAFGGSGSATDYDLLEALQRLQTILRPPFSEPDPSPPGASQPHPLDGHPLISQINSHAWSHADTVARRREQRRTRRRGRNKR
jgi:putative DNA primase/helicase